MKHTYGCRGNAVLHIHASKSAYPYAIQNPSGIYKVVAEVPQGVRLQIGCVEIRRRVAGMVGIEFRRCVGGAYRKPVFYYQRTLYLGCELTERFLHMGEVAIDVEMVGIHCGYDCNIRMQLQETPVEFVGFCNHHVVLAHQDVGAVVLGYASQESSATLSGRSKYMGDKSGCGGFAVSAGYGQALLCVGNLSQHAAALDNPVTVFAHVLEFLQAFGNGRSIYYQSFIDPGGDAAGIVVIMHLNAFLLQFCREVGRSAVVSAHVVSAELVIACDGAHPYAAYAYKVYVRISHPILFYIFRPRLSLLRPAWRAEPYSSPFPQSWQDRVQALSQSASADLLHPSP